MLADGRHRSSNIGGEKERRYSFTTRAGVAVPVVQPRRRLCHRGVRVGATFKPLKETTAEDIERSDAIAVGTWVEGFLVLRVGPAKGWLKGIGRLPALTGKPAAMFGTFGLNPRGTLATLGSVVMVGLLLSVTLGGP